MALLFVQVAVAVKVTVNVRVRVMLAVMQSLHAMATYSKLEMMLFPTSKRHRLFSGGKSMVQKGSREMVESGVNRSKLPPRVMPLVQNDNGQQYMH